MARLTLLFTNHVVTFWHESFVDAQLPFRPYLVAAIAFPFSNTKAD